MKKKMVLAKPKTLEDFQLPAEALPPWELARERERRYRAELAIAQGNYQQAQNALGQVERRIVSLCTEDGKFEIARTDDGGYAIDPNTGKVKRTAVEPATAEE